MIIKEAAESSKIKKLRLLHKRFSPEHPVASEIEGELMRSVAGYKGEKSLDFHLDLLPKDETFIFHDVRLPFGSSHFQIDVLILTSSFFLIIEVKHISGTLLFDQEFHQLIRTYKDIEEVFPDPISQLYRQTHLFKEWLSLHKFAPVPIESIVIISNPHSKIMSLPNERNISKFVTHSTNLLARFHTYQNQYSNEVIHKKDIKKLTRLLLKHHNQTDQDLFSKFMITPNNLIKGVACPACSKIPMIRVRRKWFCLSCGHYCNRAHIETLKEYALLISPTLSIHECCDFLQISSRHLAKHLLNDLHISATKLGKYKVYHLNELE
ncbi:nuclease-related domain-containing protein [Fictibacillus phosphorivorans]|uniref:nuclease-related domain-containing protein n=1 Tax=Fictibacillus phosphorivorans TaxID=1221500 RepID=UPI002041B1C5|nr:nuclease-related domain-containing protein [Fictibacillus phosphorivorans]MCM3717831.1 NERD domain-containing protein [Fictibacillus phosphorivorans]MCM3777059.1 NERD domain-containing protein [Fictibacillus phosphorivorans]